MKINDIDKYITNNFIYHDVYEKNVIELKKIADFFNKKSIDESIYIELIKSNVTLNNILKNIVDKNNELIKENINNLFNVDMMNSIVEIYCIINNIDFNFVEDYDDQFDNYCTDGINQYLNQINKTLLTEAEEIDICYRILNGDMKARNILIERNLKLVLSVVKKYPNSGVELVDLIQEGNIGLIKAAERFDVTKGYRFSTYAVWWIRQYIVRAIVEKSRNIRIPDHMGTLINIYKRVLVELRQNLNRQPTVQEIAERMNIKPLQVEKIRKCLEDTISLNLYVGDEKETEMIEYVCDPSDTPEELILKKIRYEKLKELLLNSNLNEKQMIVITERYGLNDGIFKTLDEVGKMLGVTRERIRQLEARALYRIRKSQYLENISNFDATQTSSKVENKDKIKEKKL